MLTTQTNSLLLYKRKTSPSVQQQTSPWGIGKNGEETMHALYASAKFTQRKTKPYLSPLTSPQPYLHNLNVHTHFVINIENYKYSAFLPLSRLKILNPKGRRDLPGLP